METRGNNVEEIIFSLVSILLNPFLLLDAGCRNFRTIWFQVHRLHIKPMDV